MPSAPLTLTVDATITPLKDRLKDAKRAIADLSLDTGALVDQINAKMSQLGSGNAADNIKALTAAQNDYLKSVEASARIQQAAYATGTAKGALEAATALQRLADEQSAVAARAAQATSANEREAIQLKAVAAAATIASHQFAEQADALALQARVLDRVTVSSDGVVKGHTRMNASGAELLHVVRATSDSFAAGLPPSMIFAEQIGRLGEAAALSGGALGTFGEIMSGPWGIAIVAGISLLTTLVSHLDLFTDEAIKNAEAIDKMKEADDGVASAQAALGEMFDLTTGKLKDQNDLIRTNIDLMILKLRTDAQAAQAEVSKGILSANTESWGSYISRTASNAGAGMSAAQTGYDPGQKIFPKTTIAGQILADVASGKRTGSSAFEWANTANFDRLKISRQDFQQLVIRAEEKFAKNKTADLAEQSRDTGVLDSAFIKETRGRHPRKKVDHTEQWQQQLDSAEDAAEQERLRIELQGTDDLRERARIEKEIVDAALQRKLDGNRRLKLDHTALDNQDKENAAAHDALIDRTLMRALRDKELDKANDALTAQIELLQIQGQLATTTSERRQIALDINEAERKQREIAISKAENEGRLTAPEARELMDRNNAGAAARVGLINNQNAGPLQAYADQLHRKTDDMNEALQGVKARGLQGLEDGLAGLITGTESVSSAFKKMAASIIADLARIAIEKAIVSVLGLSSGSVPAHATGTIPGFASGIISGPGTGTSDSILAWHEGKGLIRVSNGESIITAEGTRKHRSLLKAINDNTLPGFAGGYLPSYPSIPSAGSLALHPVVVQQITLDARGSITTAEFMGQVNRQMAAIGQAAVIGGAGLAQQNASEAAQQRIP